MSQTAAPRQAAPAPARDTALTYDFDRIFASVGQELFDMAHLAGVPHEVELGYDHEVKTHLLFAAAAKAEVHYAWKGTTRNGYSTPDGSTKVGDGTAARDAMMTAAKAQADDPATWDRLRHELDAEPYRAFKAEAGEIPLGQVTRRYHAFETCSGCNGRGDVRCCLTGGWICSSCNGRRQKKIYAGGAPTVVNCYDCGMTGWIPCPHCNGGKRITCAGCTGHGGYTHIWTGTLTGKWTSTLTPTLDTHPEAYAKALAMPRKLLFQQCFVSPATWGDGTAAYQATCRIGVPYLHTRFEITHLDHAHTFAIDYLGRGLLPSPMPPVLDAVIEPYVARLERTAGAAAFAVANETALGAALVGSVTSEKTSSDVVSGVLKNTISPRTAERIVSALEREAARLTRAPLRRAWIQTNLAALGLWAMVAALWGDSIRASLSRGQPDAAPLLMLCMAMALGGFVCAGLLWSRHAGRRALAAALNTPVERALPPGASAAIGSLALLAIAGCAIMGFLHR